MGHIAQAKGELLEAMDSTGVAVLNGDDPSVRGQARNFKGRIVYYGLDVANDAVGRGISMDVEGRPSFTMRYAGEEVAVHLTVPGVQCMECLRLDCRCTARVSLKDGAEALKELASTAMRLEVRRSPEE